MEIRVGNKIYNNHIRYGEYKNDDYKKLANYMLECGFGYWNSDDLYELWNEISDNYSAGWLNIPDTIEEFRHYLSSLAILYDSEDEEEYYTEPYSSNW